MTVNDIVALANAGFTADQIAQLGSVAQQPVQQTVVQPVQQPAVQPVQQTVVQPAAQPVQQTVQQPAVQTVQQPAVQTVQQPAVQQETDPFNKIMQQLGMLNTSIQANSLLAAQQPKQESVEDVLASIINPPAKDEKGGKK